jgi:hypothetical protein
MTSTASAVMSENHQVERSAIDQRGARGAFTCPRAAP